MPVQTSYAVNPDRGFAGKLARPTEPHSLDSGQVHVPAAATRKPTPGDAIVYDATENQFKLPTSAAESLTVCGILTYRADTVQGATGLVFNDNDEIEVGVFGTFWVVAGSALEYGDLIAWDRTDYKWDKLATPAAFANLVDCPIVCVSRLPVAADGLAQARIGLGRVK